MMEDSESLDLDSLIDLLDDTESENVPGISDEQSTKCEKTDKSYADVDFLSSPATQPTINEKTSDISQNNGASFVHTGDTSEEDEEEKEILTETGQQIKKNINVRPFYEKKKEDIKVTWNSKTNSALVMKEKVNSMDSLTGIKIVNPLIAFDVLEKRLQGRKLIKMSFMKNFMTKGDIDGDWVTIGVLAKKVPPKTSKAGKVYSIWKLTDLHDPEKLVSLFLFGNVHNEHWKTSVGTVIGLLNPIFMESKDREDYACMKIDHPGKIMLIGTSKDFGHCKSARKDGVQCTMVVNLSQCQYCSYHVKKEYQKFSSRRSEIQTSWTGREPSLRNKVLKGQNFFYAGQSLTPLGKPERKTHSISSKDKLTLSSLGLKRKAAVVFNEEKEKSVKKMVELFGNDVSKVAEKNSAFINNQLTIPSAGSRNLLQHMVKTKAPKGECISYVNAKDTLKQQVFDMKSRTLPVYNKKSDDAILKNLVPVLGKGLSPRQNIVFNISSPNSNSPEHFAKMRAIQRIKQSGPIQKKDPNSTKSKPELEKIKAVVESTLEEKLDDKVGEEKQVLHSALGVIDLNSEKVQRYLNKKSSHEYEVEMAEMLKEAAYFDRLEKKEAMEEKMSSTKELVCDVVSCMKCRYTSHHAAERCKDEHHPLKCHKAVKRFFECLDCKRRTECFTRFPRRSCRSCGGSRFQRTGMIKVRSGPKLDSENLKIRGDEIKFL